MCPRAAAPSLPLLQLRPGFRPHIQNPHSRSSQPPTRPIMSSSSRPDACPICCTTLSPPSVSLGCGHVLHETCLQELLGHAERRHGAKCPSCRAPIDPARCAGGAGGAMRLVTVARAEASTPQNPLPRHCTGSRARTMCRAPPSLTASATLPSAPLRCSRWHWRRCRLHSRPRHLCSQPYNQRSCRHRCSREGRRAP